MRISVAMTVSNSEKYLKEQLDSILCQIDDEAQLVISCDPSTDSTADILAEYCKKYPQIFLVKGPGKGLVKNFENAINYCENDIIFLADHDDVWIEGKVHSVLAAFDDDTMLVLHDAKICDDKLNVTNSSYMKFHRSKQGIIHNIIRNSIIGCCIAFRKELKNFATPFPENIPMHDQWLGLAAYKFGGVKFLNEPLLLYRRHDNNMSKMEHSGALKMIKWRYEIVKNLLKLQRH